MRIKLFLDLDGTIDGTGKVEWSCQGAYILKGRGMKRSSCARRLEEGANVKGRLELLIPGSLRSQ